MQQHLVGLRTICCQQLGESRGLPGRRDYFVRASTYPSRMLAVFPFDITGVLIDLGASLLHMHIVPQHVDGDHCIFSIPGEYIGVFMTGETQGHVPYLLYSTQKGLTYSQGRSSMIPSSAPECKLKSHRRTLELPKAQSTTMLYPNDSPPHAIPPQPSYSMPPDFSSHSLFHLAP